ncbi:uncharacterized protein LOC142985586 [Anticarsia gemmatalis]|uniref:uncharacterized protein LOC142985586 n=1 Tax=Anticarsia gemmatalis TaxID=129554 RepID=UPI003F775FA9
MKIIIVFIVILSFQKPTQSSDKITPNVYERVRVLKEEIMDQIRHNQAAALPSSDVKADSNTGDITDNYDYVDIDDPVTPIMDFDERKRDGRFKHKPTITLKPTTKFDPGSSSEEEIPVRSKVRSRGRIRKPKEIFYRRWDGSDPELNKPLKWVHCLDLLTPYIMGNRGNGTNKQILASNPVVLRLVHLISEYTGMDTKDEIYAILYQISNLPIRLFQWEKNALKLLFNQIIAERVHNFKTLKRGIKHMFLHWHLDIGNVTNILKQSRIFRPPCIQTSEFSGSTKSSQVFRYPTTPKKKKCRKSKEVLGECPNDPGENKEGF